MKIQAFVKSLDEGKAELEEWIPGEEDQKEEVFVTYSKEYYENNKNYFREYIKNYYNDNKQYFRNYYEKNKEKIKMKASEKVMCESCGFEVTKTYMKKHIETKRHKQIAERKAKAKLAQEVPEV